jgi:DNA-binding protein YbaB
MAYVPNMHREYQNRMHRANIQVNELRLKSDDAKISLKGHVSLENVKIDNAKIENADITTIQVVVQMTMVNGVTFGDGVCACGDKKPGFTWNKKTLCLDCIHGVVIHRDAQKDWADKFGDPLLSLKKELADLKESQLQMKKELADMQEDIEDQQSESHRAMVIARRNDTCE